jgi:WD40 repeat protein
MTADEALAIVDEVLLGTCLNDIQTIVFRACWEGQTYAVASEQAGYDEGYIKDVGAKLWKTLSQALGEKVTKSNLQSVIRRHQSTRPSREPIAPSASATAPQPLSSASSPAALSPASATKLNWGEAIDVSSFHGRNEELALLNQWVQGDRCRLIALLGMGGIGKTSLSVKFAEQVTQNPSATPFEFMIWRSLRNAPPLDILLIDLIRFLSDGQETEAELPKEIDGKIARLLHYLRTVRCLVILDNAETIMRGGDYSGYYREGYEEYSDLFKRSGEISHQSCVLLTSREKPKEMVSLEGDTLPVRSLRLSGLRGAEAKEIFQDKGAFSGSESEWQQLTERYAGNPLALKIVATMVQELFDRNISNFLQQGAGIFDDIRNLLDQQFNRLTDLEKNVMYWLAINREPTSFAELQDDTVATVLPPKLMEAVGSLARRSLIEKHFDRYTQQPVVMEYVTEDLISQVAEEIVGGRLWLFMSHALIKAPSKDYVRESQIRVILEGVIDRLTILLKSKQAVKKRLDQTLMVLKEEFEDVPGYGGGNLINLFRHLKVDLKDYDFSRLALWEAYLLDVKLYHVDFSYTDLSKCVFAETLGSVISVAFSPNGKQFASGDANGEIVLWRVSDGQQLFTCREHVNWVWSVCFSPDSQTLASGGEDKTVRLWDVTTGQCMQEFRGHTNWIRSVKFSPEGEILASASEDHTVKLWQLSTGACIQTLTGHTGGIEAIAFNRDGQLLASAGVDQTVKLWQLSTGLCIQSLTGHMARIWAVAFSPDGQLLATAGDDKTVRIWQVETGNCFRTMTHSSRIWSVAFSTDGQYLVIGSDDQTIYLWEISTGQSVRAFVGHSNRIWSVACSADGQLLISGSDDQTIRLWELSTGQCLRTFWGYCNLVWTVTCSPDAQFLASGHEDRIARLWNFETGECVQTLSGHTGRVWSVAFSPNSQILASGSDDQTIRLWQVKTGRCYATLRGHTRYVRSLVFTPDGNLLASASGDYTVKLWNVESGHCVKTLRGEGWIFSLAVSPNGRYLATNGETIVWLWEVQTGERYQLFEGQINVASSVAFSSDGRLLASGSDQTIRLWDVQTRECLTTLSGHQGWIAAIAFHPSGKILASTSSDQTVKLWDVETSECLNTLEGHTRGVNGVAFSPDGQRLITSSEDETIRIWQTQTGQCLQVLQVERPYEGMNIMGVTGLTDAQKATLKALGAVEI